MWDVTDRDIDKFSQSVFNRLRLDPANVKAKKQGKGGKGVSVVRAVAESREICKLKYLNGAAPVVYGIPFYL
jgi:separase